MNCLFAIQPFSLGSSREGHVVCLRDERSRDQSDLDALYCDHLRESFVRLLFDSCFVVYFLSCSSTYVKKNLCVLITVCKSILLLLFQR